MGHSGGGMFPLTLLPDYQRLRQAVWETETCNLTKSSTYKKRFGNYVWHNPRTWKYVQPIGRDGLLNAYGLTNKGVETHAKEIALAGRDGFKVIPSFYPEFKGDLDATVTDTVEAITSYIWHLDDDFRTLELNLSCPNADKKIKKIDFDALAYVKIIRKKYPRLCLIAKISYEHDYEFAQELVNLGVDIIHAVNAIPYELVYLFGKQSPLANVGGGAVSGGPAQHLALSYCYHLRKVLKGRMIMGCGITSLDDAKKYLTEVGADAISICTVARLNPYEAEKIIEKYN